MVQKKIAQKNSQKEKKSQAVAHECDRKTKNEINNNKDVKKDENSNKVKKVEIKNEFCKGNHFVCSKFTDDQYKFVRESLIKLKDEKGANSVLDLSHLEEILDDHHLLTRYMMKQRRDSEKQIELIIKVLRWREENHISMIKKRLFPKEAIEMAPIFPYRKTKTGEIVCYLRFCLYPHTEIDFMDEFSIFQLYAVNRLAIEHNTTWIWFFDFTNATKNNVDVKRSRFMIDILNTYFPFANSKAIVYNLPWYLSFMKPVFFSFLPQHIKKVVQFYDPKNLTELIDPKNLPPFLGGAGKLDDCEFYRTFMDSEGSVSIEEWVKNPPEEVPLFKENAVIQEMYEKAKSFLGKQAELIESLKKKNVII